MQQVLAPFRLRSSQRALARNTQMSYRDTLTLLLPFASRRAAVPIDGLSVPDLSPSCVRAFLEHVEHDRSCSVATRNVRLSAVHSLAIFIGMRSPEHLAWCTEVRTIPFKKTSKTVVGYLEKPELDALLRAPDRGTAFQRVDDGRRDFRWNGKSQADVAAIGRFDHAVDANDIATEVEHRATRVALVDRRDGWRWSGGSGNAIVHPADHRTLT